jgi:beta-galactosidase beta subunit
MGITIADLFVMHKTRMMEVHKKYADLQYAASGKERILRDMAHASGLNLWAQSDIVLIGEKHV